eukprot:gene5969-biopygen11809
MVPPQTAALAVHQRPTPQARPTRVRVVAGVRPPRRGRQGVEAPQRAGVDAAHLAGRERAVKPATDGADQQLERKAVEHLHAALHVRLGRVQVRLAHGLPAHVLHAGAEVAWTAPAERGRAQQVPPQVGDDDVRVGVRFDEPLVRGAVPVVHPLPAAEHLVDQPARGALPPRADVDGVRRAVVRVAGDQQAVAPRAPRAVMRRRWRPGVLGITESAVLPALAGRCSYGGPGVTQHVLGKVGKVGKVGNIGFQSHQRRAGACQARREHPSAGKTTLPVIPGTLGAPAPPPPPQGPVGRHGSGRGPDAVAIQCKENGGGRTQAASFLPLEGQPKARARHRCGFPSLSAIPSISLQIASGVYAENLIAILAMPSKGRRKGEMQRIKMQNDGQADRR